LTVPSLPKTRLPSRFVCWPPSTGPRIIVQLTCLPATTRSEPVDADVSIRHAVSRTNAQEQSTTATIITFGRVARAGKGSAVCDWRVSVVAQQPRRGSIRCGCLYDGRRQRVLRRASHSPIRVCWRALARTARRIVRGTASRRRPSITSSDRERSDRAILLRAVLCEGAFADSITTGESHLDLGLERPSHTARYFSSTPCTCTNLTCDNFDDCAHCSHTHSLLLQAAQALGFLPVDPLPAEGKLVEVSVVCNMNDVSCHACSVDPARGR
jgi:hypothetical protein